jgi:hypothetical protein
MSHTTTKLSSNLREDLSAIFNPYQLEEVFSGGRLWPDATPKEAQAFALARSLVKKFNESTEPTKAQQDVALKKFLAVNDRCGNWELNLLDSRDTELWLLLKQEIYEFWYLHDDQVASVCDSLSAAMHAGGVGKGASAFARAPDFYTKLFDSPLSCTKVDLLKYWEGAMSIQPHWKNANSTRSNRYADRIAEGNKLSFVAKNVDTARCISIEATVNMWFQLGLGNLICDRLRKKYGIDMSTQPEINGQLARLGSIHGSFATLDLESASDSISNRMLDQLLPKGMHQWLRLFRSDVCRLPSNRKLTLEMVATMGNGFCFPLQTLIFSSIIRAVYKFRGINLLESDCRAIDPRAKNYGTFGDDMIVVTDAVRDVVRLLNICGFVVNESKSHVEGPFRESCGSDFYAGVPCRGVYIKRLSSAQDHYVAINTLNRWSAMTGIALQNTVRYIRAGVVSNAPLVPCDEDDTAGIHVPSDLAVGTRRGLYGCWKYRKDAPIPVVAKFFGDSMLNVQMVPEGTVDDRAQVHRKVNLAGLLISFLGGYIAGDDGDVCASFTERTRIVRYRTRHATTPCWDFFPTVQVDIKVDGARVRPNRMTHVSDFAAWSAAVHQNL